ncbi:hypothetical protein P154DRAFT_489655 [Amniculicola lignicola CBS 123094]|uniref:Zn(2)-C6 fungal-type domain-containing protein n=1 Tax=Amniculicola lignicola CBS 123094 TaxID=1392246 RepID=A0A6A5WIP9_9PLEO|nr:hypothetical protein P154DRAFT_489655 [Amniculicola lignicola CBS 123094]
MNAKVGDPTLPPQGTHSLTTCLERKVGCDRALPECVNCTRSKRLCKGYHLKLAWPDKVDGRRKQKKYQALQIESPATYITQDGSFSFLNTTFNDLKSAKVNVQEIVEADTQVDSLTIAPPMPLHPSIPGLKGEGLYLSYWDSVLARMITTIDDNTNGFRFELMPMALSSSDTSSQSLLQATLALSAFHLGRPDEALRHKVRAIKSLSQSFQGGNVSKLVQMSACMMLCVYSVFDASDTTWNLHLQGARTITKTLSREEQESPAMQFLTSWFDYHDVFSSYSYASEVDPQMINVQIVLPGADFSNRKVIGLLGCSTELLKLISCINQLRALNTGVQRNTPEMLNHSLQIRKRLQSLSQEIHIAYGEATVTIDHDRITLTAELYRIAALLYLYEVAPPQAVPEHAVESLVRECFITLGQLEVCTSPWPLFILACNVTSDVDRLKTLGIIKTAEQKRHIGNYRLIKGIIEAVWKQQDLVVDEKNPRQIDWRKLIRPNSAVPSFI